MEESWHQPSLPPSAITDCGASDGAQENEAPHSLHAYFSSCVLLFQHFRLGEHIFSLAIDALYFTTVLLLDRMPKLFASLIDDAHKAISHRIHL